MNKVKFTLNTLVVGFILIATTSLVQAQTARTWVSALGSDSNPCTYTAPCRTYSGAYTETAANGEISTKDAGAYGTFATIKSITIDGSESLAGILTTSATTGIVISNSGAHVILRNLDIHGGGIGTDGIRITGAASVVIENCRIYGFTGYGIKWQTNVNGTLTVKNTSIDNCTLGGISIGNTGGAVRAAIENVKLHRNGFGIRTGTLAVSKVINSSATASTDGFLVDSDTGQMNLDRCTATHNTNGVTVSGGGAVRISNSTISNNSSTGLNFIFGVLESYGNNMIRGNPASSVPSVFLPT